MQKDELIFGTIITLKTWNKEYKFLNQKEIKKIKRKDKMNEKEYLSYFK